MAEQRKKKGKGKKVLKGILALILVLVIIVGGFILGIYLRIFDTQTMNEKLGLYNMPIIGQYFVKPTPKEPAEQEPPAEDKKVEDTSKQKQKQLTITKAELEKQQKEREAEEKKHVKKLANLYNAMKPADAASALDTLDDDLCVEILQKMDEDQAAKVLSAFTPEKTGRLTKLIYAGKKQKVQSAADMAQEAEQEQNAANQPNP